MTDAAGNVTSYGYDTLARLTSAVTKTSGGTQTASYTYGYDPVGNLTSKTINGTTTSYGYNSADQLSGATFDANGNQLTRSDGLTFIYNAADQTTGIIPNGGSIIGQSYLGDGQTRRTASGGNSYQYDQTGMSVATVIGTTAYLTKTPDGELLSERIPSGTSAGNYYYLYDGLGSVVALTNSSGGVVDTYAYDPYGTTTSTSGSVPNAFRFIGAEWDASTGLYKMGERYYDPSVGRFTQLDPLGEGYVYSHDDPINGSDPSGLMDDVGGGASMPAPGSAYDPIMPGEDEAPVEEANAPKTEEPVPERAKPILKEIKENHYRAPRGYKGGRVFENRQGRLPRNGRYREYDIKPHTRGVNRGPERIVVDTKTGRAWYTDDHYKTFVPIP